LPTSIASKHCQQAASLSQGGFFACLFVHHIFVNRKPTRPTPVAPYNIVITAFGLHRLSSTFGLYQDVWAVSTYQLLSVDIMCQLYALASYVGQSVSASNVHKHFACPTHLSDMLGGHCG
jgi:hypothetical protein